MDVSYTQNVINPDSKLIILTFSQTEPPPAVEGNHPTAFFVLFH